MQSEKQESKNGLLSLSDALNRRFELPDEMAPEVTAELDSESATIVAHSFILGDTGFLIPNDLVSEVVQDLPLCQLPHVPPWLWGMVNLRGNLLPLFDLSDLFGYGQSDPLRHKLLVINIGDEMVSIVIDRLPTREVFSADDRLSSQPLLPNSLKMHTRACYKMNDRIWVDWDPEEFFMSLSGHW